MAQRNPENGPQSGESSLMTAEELEVKRQELMAKREEKRRQKRLRMLFFLSLVIFALVLAGLTAYYTICRNLAVPVTVQPGEGQSPDQSVQLERFNFVVLGADEKPDDPGRTDTIMVASIDFNHRHLSVISVPRDTMVSIPGRQGRQRINAAHAFGGPELTVQTLSQFLGMPLRYYVKINFEGFEKIVDTLGGVWIDVEKPMYYEDKAQNLVIDLKPGRQNLNGKQALGYVRFRHDGLGDVALVDPSRQVYDGRVDRQQKFVKALIQQVLQAKTVTKLPVLLSQLQDAVQTNIPYTTMLRLALKANDIQSGTVETAIVPGSPQIVDGASYWVPDEAGLRLMVGRMLLGQDKITVEVLNGSGVRGAAGAVAQRLREQGFAVIGVADARSYDYSTTKILARPGRRHAAEKLAAVLRVDDVTVTREIPGNDVDLTIIVGKDYRP